MKENTAQGGIGFCGLLAIVFIVLKLCGVIDWAWVWVLAPIWGSFLIALAIAFVAIVAYVIKEASK